MRGIVVGANEVRAEIGLGEHLCRDTKAGPLDPFLDTPFGLAKRFGIVDDLVFRGGGEVVEALIGQADLCKVSTKVAMSGRR